MNSKTVLITGANRGIGLGLVRHYLDEGWNVHAVARGESSELAIFAGSHPDQLVLHQLDVTDFGAIDALAAELGQDALDVLVNNAGIYSDNQQFGALNYDDWRHVLEVNTLAPAKMAEALSQTLKADGTMVFISSIQGSIATAEGDQFIYGSSKAALNMVAKLIAAKMKERGFRVLTLHPGSVITDMNPGGKITVKDSVAGMARVIAAATPGASDIYKDYTGKALPW